MMNKMPILYRVGRFILGPFFKWYYKPTIIGKENIPKSGAILIVGNHKHLYDQCLSIISTKRYIRYMAKKTDAYLVPFGITGDYTFRSKNLVIRYGKPFKVTDMDMESANELLYNTVKSLMEENLK